MKSLNTLGIMIIAGIMGIALAAFGAGGQQYIEQIRRLTIYVGIGGALFSICLSGWLLIIYTRTRDEKVRQVYLRMMSDVLGYLIVGLGLYFLT